MNEIISESSSDVSLLIFKKYEDEEQEPAKSDQENY